MTEFKIGDTVKVELTGEIVKLNGSVEVCITAKGLSDYNYHWWVPVHTATLISRSFTPRPGELYRDREDDLWVIGSDGLMTYLRRGDPDVTGPDVMSGACLKNMLPEDVIEQYGPFTKVEL